MIHFAVLGVLVLAALVVVVVVAEAPVEALGEALVVLALMASAQMHHKTVAKVPQAVL